MEYLRNNLPIIVVNNFTKVIGLFVLRTRNLFNVQVDPMIRAKKKVESQIMQVEVHATNLNDSSRPWAVSKTFYPGDKHKLSQWNQNKQDGYQFTICGTLRTLKNREHSVGVNIRIRNMIPWAPSQTMPSQTMTWSVSQTLLSTLPTKPADATFELMTEEQVLDEASLFSTSRTSSKYTTEWIPRDLQCLTNGRKSF